MNPSPKALEANAKTARRIAAAIEADFTGRRGLRQEWEGIDDGIQREIRETWIEIIEKELNE